MFILVINLPTKDWALNLGGVLQVRVFLFYIISPLS